MPEINQEYIKYIIIIIIITLLGYLLYLLYKDMIVFKQDLETFKNRLDQQIINPDEFDEDECEESSSEYEEEEYNLQPNNNIDMFEALDSILEESESDENQITEVGQDNVIEDNDNFIIETSKETNYCPVLLKTGKNKGNNCNKPIIFGGNTCKIHQ